MTADTPTPPSPGEQGGWLTMTDDEAQGTDVASMMPRPRPWELHLSRWQFEAHAQRTARQQAERERDELNDWIREHDAYLAAEGFDVERGVAGVIDARDEARADLAAAESRAAALLALAEEYDRALDKYAPGQVNEVWRIQLRARLAALKGGIDA